MKHWDDSGVLDFEDDFLGDGHGHGNHDDLDYDDPFMDDVFSKPRGMVGKKPKPNKREELKPKSKEIKTKHLKAAAPATPAKPTAATDTTAGDATSPTPPKAHIQSSRPKKQKKKAKKIVPKMGERDPDLFDDPVLWETRDRKRILDEKASKEADAFWGGENEPQPEELVDRGENEQTKMDEEEAEAVRRLNDIM